MLSRATLWWVTATYFPDFCLPVLHLMPSMREIPSSCRVHIWYGKIRMAGLQSVEGRMMINSVVWAQYINVTDAHSKCCANALCQLVQTTKYYKTSPRKASMFICLVCRLAKKWMGPNILFATAYVVRENWKICWRTLSECQVKLHLLQMHAVNILHWLAETLSHSTITSAVQQQLCTGFHIPLHE